MTVIDLGIKRRSVKLLLRINESITTLLFIITSILQAVIIISLEVRVYHRNESIHRQLYRNLEECLEPSVIRMNSITEENVAFVVFQVFQMLLCFNAVYNQNKVQVFTIAAINFFCACFGGVQMFEVHKWYGDFKNACPDSPNSELLVRSISRPSFYTHDIPLLAALLIFAFIMSILSWNLYRQFGWNMYKKIGGDINKQAMYKTYLFYVMLLKLDLFFVLALALSACTVFKINLRMKETSIRLSRYLPRSFYSLHIGVSVLIFLNQIIGYRSAKKENKSGMIFVCVSWIIILADFCILLRYSIGGVRDSWYFFIVYLGIGIIMTILSFIWSIFVYKNFGKGFQDHIHRQKTESPVSNNNVIPVTGKRFPIEID